MKRFAILAALALAGCANWAGREEAMRSRFVGQPLDEVIRAIGVPYARVRLSDGSEIVEFRTWRSNFQCLDEFATDPRGIVVRTRHAGQDGCTLGKQP